MDPDLLLDEISKISRCGVHKLTPQQSVEALSVLSHKINQLVDWIEMGGRLPKAFTWIHEVRAEAAKRAAEEAGC